MCAWTFLNFIIYEVWNNQEAYEQGIFGGDGK